MIKMIVDTSGVSFKQQAADMLRIANQLGVKVVDQTTGATVSPGDDLESLEDKLAQHCITRWKSQLDREQRQFERWSGRYDLR